MAGDAARPGATRRDQERRGYGTRLFLHTLQAAAAWGVRRLVVVASTDAVAWGLTRSPSAVVGAVTHRGMGRLSEMVGKQRKKSFGEALKSALKAQPLVPTPPSELEGRYAKQKYRYSAKETTHVWFRTGAHVAADGGGGGGKGVSGGSPSASLRRKSKSGRR